MIKVNITVIIYLPESRLQPACYLLAFSHKQIEKITSKASEATKFLMRLGSPASNPTPALTKAALGRCPGCNKGSQEEKRYTFKVGNHRTPANTETEPLKGGQSWQKRNPPFRCHRNLHGGEKERYRQTGNKHISLICWPHSFRQV